MLSQLVSLLGGGVSASAWILTISGSGAEAIYACAAASDGLVVVGSTTSEGAGSNEGWVAKIGSDGSLQWQRRIGSSNAEQLSGVTVDGSGNIYAVGTNGLGDGLICKWNSSGTLQWQKKWANPAGGSDGFSAVDCDSGGNVYASGRVATGTSSSFDFLLVKFNSSGVVQWYRFVGGAGTEGTAGGGVAIDTSDNVYIASETASTGGAGYADMMIGKFNTSGTNQWLRSLGGAGEESGTAIATDTSGNVYAVGRSDSSGGAGGSDVLLCKYNASGTIQWQRSIGGANYDTGYGVATDSDGNVYVAGVSDPASSGVYDFLICKYNASGTIQWQRTLATSGNDQLNGLAVDATGYLYVVGSTGSPTEGIIARLPTDGSKTGTYGSWTYATASKTDQSRSLTDQSRALTITSSTGGESTVTLTEAAAARTTSLTEIA